MEKIGPLAVSRTKKEPGIFEKLDSITDKVVSDKGVFDLKKKIPMDDMASFYDQTDILWSEKFYYDVMKKPDPITKHSNYERLIREGFLLDLRTNLRGVEVLNREIKRGYVIFTEIHCPKIKGCKASFTQKTERSRDYFFNFKVAGFSGGFGRSVNVGLGSTINITEKCLAIYKPIKVQIEECFDMRRNKKFYRASILKFEDGFNHQQIPSDDCYCQTSQLRLKEEGLNSNEHHIIESETFDTFIEKGKTFEFGSSIFFDTFELGAKITIETKKTSKYSYTLNGEQTYYSFNLKNHHGRHWTWK